MKKLMFPGTFLVGNDILKDFVKNASCFGKKFVFIGDEISLSVSRDQLTDSFKGSDCQCEFVLGGKLCCTSEVNRIAALKEVQDADVICAVGGGGSMDISKAIAFEAGKALVMVPTTASSDAPCTFATLRYSEDGSHIISDYMHFKCPDLVMIDTRIVANAPSRLIAAGMGDAMATWYEGSTCYKNKKLGSSITETAMALCQMCKTIIQRDGLAAYEAVTAKVVTPQLENVVEANCFLSSMGGLNSGNACGHGFGDWLASVEGGHDFLHGERVFVGLILQMILEKYPMDEILDMMKFGRKVGLPICVGDVTKENLESVAKRAGDELQNDHFMVNLNCDFTPNILSGSILYAQYLADNLSDK